MAMWNIVYLFRYRNTYDAIDIARTYSVYSWLAMGCWHPGMASKWMPTFSCPGVHLRPLWLTCTCSIYSALFCVEYNIWFERVCMSFEEESARLQKADITKRSTFLYRVNSLKWNVRAYSRKIFKSSASQARRNFKEGRLHDLYKYICRCRWRRSTTTLSPPILKEDTRRSAWDFWRSVYWQSYALVSRRFLLTGDFFFFFAFLLSSLGNRYWRLLCVDLLGVRIDECDVYASVSGEEDRARFL